MDERLIKLELTVNEINFILFSLSEKKYSDVYLLIPKIQEQANQQLSE